MKALILLGLISLQAFSQEICEEDHSELSNIERTIKKVVSHHDPAKPRVRDPLALQEFSASGPQVLLAPCKTKTPPTNDQMDMAIKSAAGPKKTNDNVYGVDFRDESPVLIEMFKRFTMAVDSLGLDPDPKKQKNIQSIYQINPGCEKVACAVEKIWGPDYSKKMSYLYLKHGYNISDIAYQFSKKFKPDELNDVLMAIEDLPPFFVPLGDLGHQQLIRYSIDQSSDGDSETLADSSLEFFNAWAKYSSPDRQMTVFHELSHNLARFLKGPDAIYDLDETQEWLDLGKWTDKGGDWSHKGGCMVSEYGSEEPGEDFAETMTAYRYNPKFLKARCPAKYEYAKTKIFRGVEYLDESCSQ